MGKREEHRERGVGGDREGVGADDNAESLNATQGTSAIIFPLQLGQLWGKSQNSSKLFLESPFPL